MKYVKMLGLLAVAAAALMAFAGTASATSLTSPTGTGTTGPIHAVSEGHATLHGPEGTGLEVSCPSTVEGSVTSHGAGKPASGPITSLVFGATATAECTDGDVVHVKKAGTLSVTSTGGYNGTLTSSGAEIEITNDIGVTCVYTTNNTHIGTVAGGNPATLTINSATIPRTGGSFFCGSHGFWTGAYKTTAPLYIDA
jgi:hypothetical protein